MLFYRLGSSLRTPLALVLRNSAAITSTTFLRSSCLSLLRACEALGQDGSMPAPFRRNRPTLRFSRDILVPTTGVRESCSLSGALPSGGSCALRPEQLQVYRSGTFCASSSRSVTWRTYPLLSALSIHQKAVGPPPLPGRWPSDPYRPVTGLRNAPLGAVLRVAPRSIEVSNHRWTFVPLFRPAAQSSNTLDRAIGVPNLFLRQILTNSCPRRFDLPKTGETVVLRSAFRKEPTHKSGHGSAAVRPARLKPPRCPHVSHIRAWLSGPATVRSVV